MRDVTIENVTELVIASLGRQRPIAPRAREILEALIRHLHGFCRETRLNHTELLEACAFLGRAGAGGREEYILLADLLGVEVLVDMISNPVAANETISTVLGPFFRENAPVMPKGTSTVQQGFEGQETVYIEGYVRDPDGKPLAGAIVNVWEDAPNGLYENHDPDQPDYNLRGRFETDENGHYAFRAIRPVPYAIPDGGAAGELIRFMGHHGMRPAHVHMMVSHDGYRRLVTQIYDSSSDWLDDDSVFAVKEALVGEFRRAPEGADTDLVLRYDFVLRRMDQAR
ncbi:dioxygenase family protein [Gemmobacter serpentinus]|uniref:dioxygenase family protein n=1 Tax=Gemmobacter serpentinus TaxID=2652247 RepID=UPI00124E93AC|nr:dioxygenase [Gemmobacter serpentinus]